MNALFPLQLLLLMLSLAWLPAYATPKCPDIEQLRIPTDTQGWQQLKQTLAQSMPFCLTNSNYYALYGAAQLNSGHLSQALESLERALLLNPNNGGALIDYSLALYLNGDLFAAIELNKQLQLRQDLPPHLQRMLKQHEESWHAATLRRENRIGIKMGYDSNINGAPGIDSIDLTFPDQSINLTLSDDSRPISEEQLKLHLSSLLIKNNAQGTQHWYGAINSRNSSHQSSDLIELNASYGQSLHQQNGFWQFTTNLNHLIYGGNGLYQSAEVSSYYYQISNYCQPYLGSHLEYQRFSGQQQLNGIELSGSVGSACNIAGQSLITEIKWLYNLREDSHRPGGDRYGWQLKTQWQRPLYKGKLTTELQLSRTQDKRSYNSLLASGASRDILRSAFSLEYNYPINPGININLSLFHQQQRSNISLFQNRKTTADIGIAFVF